MSRQQVGGPVSNAAYVQVQDRERPGANAATRYLCAASHLDRGFAEWVVRTLIEERHRAIGPSDGVDLAPIAMHAIEATRRRLVRDGVVAGLVLLAALIDVGSTLLFLFLLLAAGGTRRLLSGATPRRRRAVKSAFALLAVLVVVAILLVNLAGALLFSAPLLLGPGAAAPGAVAATVAGRQLLLFACCAGLVAAVAAERLAARRVLVERLKRNRFAPTAVPRRYAPRLRRRLTELQALQDGNVTVYSGDMPFVGAGALSHTWSFTLNLMRAKGDPAAAGAADRSPPPRLFPLATLYTTVRSRIERLRDEGGRPGQAPAHRLDGLVVSDRVFADGGLLREDQRLLPHPGGLPVTALPGPELDRILDASEGPVRYYQVYRTGSWGGEVVRTVFVRFVLSGRILYTELVACLLPPIAREYHAVDTLAPNLTVLDVAGLVWNALLDLPEVVGRAPGSLLRAALAPLRRDASLRLLESAAAGRIDLDYGAETTAREAAADTGFHNYFQFLDAMQHLKLVQVKALDALVDFLDERGFDTGEARAQQSVIIQQGIQLFGGNNTVQAGQLAVGQGASVQNGAGPGGGPAGQAAGAGAPAPTPAPAAAGGGA